GNIGFFYRTEQPGTIPLYEFFNPRMSDHFYSIRAGEKRYGYESRGVIGFVFPKAMCGSTPLYRLFNKTKKIYFFTTSASKRAMAVRSGYKNEGTAGYM
ncbi:hypothetical protein L208DRAFT_1122922, partial [Tricholoma matsutake]